MKNKIEELKKKIERLEEEDIKWNQVIQDSGGTCCPSDEEVEENVLQHKLAKAELKGIEEAQKEFQEKIEKLINDFFDEWELDIKFKKTMRTNLLNRLKKEIFGGENEK